MLRLRPLRQEGHSRGITDRCIPHRNQANSLLPSWLQQVGAHPRRTAGILGERQILVQKTEYLRVKPSMAALQAGYGMKTIKEQQATKDKQYNQLVAQFASGHTAPQGSISNLTATNATQQQQFATLQTQLTQRANSAAQVNYCPPVGQPTMQIQMPMQQQQQQQQGQHGQGGHNGGRCGRNNNGWQG
jgi:hypothetical protein